MGILGRSDGVRPKREHVLRKIMPHLMPTRTEAIVYFDQEIPITGTRAYLAQHEEVNLFQVILAAMARALAERPGLNRFVAGRKIYQREEVAISFAVKKQFSDKAKLTTVKVIFEAEDTLAKVGERVKEAVGVGKAEKDTSSEKEMNLASYLPRSLIRFFVWFLRVADYWGLIPGAMLKNDPLYASLFVANLGSVGLDAAYHHLFEYGTVPLFAVVGKTKKVPYVKEDDTVGVREVVPIRYTFDERINDGFYCVKSLENMARYVEQPELLEAPGAAGSID
ncbi:MAG: 2-oxo acid dehydrogenase subunit E2 [Deltaproteobacteria bacterium]|nr:2-oxo acid dehydrogenase subunit E2 [Deltaproteobacteria bacterium]